MSQRILGTATSEGYVSKVYEEGDGRVHFRGDADIDADGANGQHGAKPAYMTGNRGSEHLGNGGMGMRGGRVVGIESWFRDIVICGKDGQPLEFPGGVIASKTAYRYPGKAEDDPAAYVDSETIPYIVVPPWVVRGVKGKVLGCLARCTLIQTGKQVDGVTADIGPRSKVGEVSIAMARALAIPSNPRTGGISTPGILFELWPGTPAQGFNFR